MKQRLRGFAVSSGMRTVVLGLCLLLPSCALLHAPLPPGGEVTISYRDVRAGEDELPPLETKLAVSVDGVSAGESDAADRYRTKTLRIRVAPGPRRILIEGMAFRNGAWERRMASGGHLFDHRLEKTVDLADGGKTAITFLVPDRKEKIVIRLGDVPPTPVQPGGDEESASR